MGGRMQTSLESFQSSPHFWDWITLVCVMLTVLGFLVLLVWLLGLPGRIAIARNHPDAEAVYTMGWVGFIAIVPWIQALIWAFKPTDKVDIRYLPEEERYGELEELQRLSRYALGRDLPKEQVDALLRRGAGQRPPGLDETGPGTPRQQDPETRADKTPDAPSSGADKSES